MSARRLSRRAQVVVVLAVLVAAIALLWQVQRDQARNADYSWCMTHPGYMHAPASGDLCSDILGRG